MSVERKRCATGAEFCFDPGDGSRLSNQAERRQGSERRPWRHPRHTPQNGHCEKRNRDLVTREFSRPVEHRELEADEATEEVQHLRHLIGGEHAADLVAEAQLGCFVGNRRELEPRTQ